MTSRFTFTDSMAPPTAPNADLRVDALPLDRIRGSLLGAACGDALGAPAEFLTVAEIRERFGPDGPQNLGPDQHLVTDDTQMLLSVGEALFTAWQDPPLRPETLGQALRREFVAWAQSHENDRDPGMTVMRACMALADGLGWEAATVRESKGAGANMRVAPVGLAPLTASGRATIARFQAAITHGHATGLAAAELTAEAVHRLAAGLPPAQLMESLIARAEERSRVYEERWLGKVWERPGVETPEDFIAAGFEECIDALRGVAAAAEALQKGTADDPCAMTGGGWVADEALASALACFLYAPDDPVKAVRRACVTSGDSDTIACITGQFAGAHAGVDAWPTQWIDIVERREDLDRLAARLAE